MALQAENDDAASLKVDIKVDAEDSIYTQNLTNYLTQLCNITHEALHGYCGAQTVRAIKLWFNSWFGLGLYVTCIHNKSQTSRTTETYFSSKVIFFTPENELSNC